MGKSSVIQSLLLLRQSHLKNLLSSGLELNADLCDIGTAKDAIYQFAESDNIEFCIKRNANISKFSFLVDHLSAVKDTFLKRNYSSDDQIGDSEGISLLSKNFQYISASRIGPCRFYTRNTSAVEYFNQISSKNGQCEWTAHFLDYNKKYIIPDVLRHTYGSNDLFSQTQEWLREVSPDIYIHLEPSDSTYKLTYSYNRGEGKSRTENFNAVNVGYGVSYILPIIVAILSAKPGTLIIVENPESHVHPSAQSKLMHLLCKAANFGIQLIIETHSDHIINGLLVSIKKGIISNDKTSIYFFDKNKMEHATEITNIEITENGRIPNAPAGFFDQIGSDLRTLMGR